MLNSLGLYYDAQGDLAKTAGGVANASRSLGGRWENLLADMGQSLEPVTQKVLAIANVGLAKIGEALTGSKARFPNGRRHAASTPG